MAANPSKNDGQGEDQPPERARDDESTSDDESVSDDDSSSSLPSSESSTDDTSTGSPPPSESVMNGDQIRKNARELLLSSPDTASAARNTTTSNAHGYQSYHDAPTVRMSPTSSSQFASSDGTGTAPPWATNQNNQTDDGLSMTDVASMAFSCVAHCLTEGYRAASSYYSDHDQSQYPSVSGSGNVQNYQQVSVGYQNEMHIDRSAPYNHNDNQQTSSTNNGYQNGYTNGGYQTKFSDQPNQHREIMERGEIPQSSNDGDCAAGHTSRQVQKEEWATVHVPSTYQGGRVGGGN